MTDKLQQPSSLPDDHEIDLMTVLITLARHKKLITGCTLGFGAVAMALSLILPPIYTATSTLMPPHQQQGSMLSAMLGQLGALAGATSSLSGLKDPNEVYIGILQSDTVANDLIKRFNLRDRLHAKSNVETRAKLSKLCTIESDKNGLIDVSVDDEDPQFAAKLANAYVEELERQNDRLAVSDASRRRLFYQQQLNDTKTQLTNAENALEKTQQHSGMIQPDGQVQLIIANVAQIKAAIASKEVELAAMRSFATGQNPGYQRSLQELAALRANLAQLVRNQSLAADGVMVPTSQIPQTALEYARRFRDVKYYEAMYELLSKEYESARLDEANDSSVIQVLDVATAPDQKTRPKRALITLAGVFGGLFIGILASFCRDMYLASRRNDPEGRWLEFAATWRGSRARKQG